MRWSPLSAPVGWVVLGGSAGTALRTAAESQLPRPADLPLPTLVVNLVGALVLGALLEHLARTSAGDDDGGRRAVRLLVGTGFCGGLTTYSAFAVQTHRLGLTSRRTAAAYAVGTLGAALAACALGFALGAGPLG